MKAEWTEKYREDLRDDLQEKVEYDLNNTTRDLAWMLIEALNQLDLVNARLDECRRARKEGY